MESDGFSMDVTQDEDTTVVTLRGEVDLNAKTSLQDMLLALATDGTTMTVDLSEVAFIDSTGLALLVMLHGRCTGSGGQLIIRAPSENVTRLITMTGLDTTLVVEDQD